MGAKIEITTAEEPFPMVAIDGEVDHFNCNVAESAIKRLLRDDVKELTIDLSRTVYVDTAGVAMIFWTTKQLNDRGGCLTLIVPTGDVRRILELAGVGSLPATKIYTSLREAAG